MFDTLQERIAVGKTAFLEKVRELAGTIDAETSGKKLLRNAIPFSKVVGVVEDFKGEKWESFASRYGDWGRDLALYLARERCGLTLLRLARKQAG